MTDQAAKVTIKKYANRRLYDTESSTYVTLERLAEMIRDGRDFTVVDAKTGEDLTQQVLTQIIVEAEGRGGTMLPISFLRQIIGLYGGSMQGMVPAYLESAMESFHKNGASFADAFGANILGDMAKRNMAMLEEAGRAFAKTAAPPSGKPPGAGDDDEVAKLRAELDALRAKVDRLGR